MLYLTIYQFFRMSTFNFNNLKYVVLIILLDFSLMYILNGGIFTALVLFT